MKIMIKTICLEPYILFWLANIFKHQKKYLALFIVLTQICYWKKESHWEKFQLLYNVAVGNQGDNNNNRNTKPSTRTWIDMYQSWVKLRERKENIEEYTTSKLNDVLSQNKPIKNPYIK